MADESKNATVLKVYTSNRPPVGDNSIPSRETPPDKHSHHRTIPLKTKFTTPYAQRLARNAMISCAVLMGILSIKILPFPWAQQATAAMSNAINLSVDLDKTLGQLQFVREVIPETTMVFWNGGASASEFAQPFKGEISHKYTADQPWLEYLGNNQNAVSIQDGIVRQIEQGSAGDWAIRIEHKGKIESVYAFLSAVNVNVGDTVSRSQEIGHVAGQNGARMYFEIRKDEKSVDPAPYLALK